MEKQKTQTVMKFQQTPFGLTLGHMSPVHNVLVKNLCIKLYSLASAMTALKTILIYV